jgi:hypothetical protein
MTFQEACWKSPYQRAYRATDRGKYFMEFHGAAIFVDKNFPFIREASPEEVEGFNDWQPVE